MSLFNKIKSVFNSSSDDVPDAQTIYFKNGEMYKVYPTDKESWYDARYLVSDGVKYDLENLEEAAEWIMKKTQTIVCGGVESQIVTQSLIRQQKGCVDRVVPMGQALAMERKWDGYDLFGTLAKQVEAGTV